MSQITTIVKKLFVGLFSGLFISIGVAILSLVTYMVLNLPLGLEMREITAFYSILVGVLGGMAIMLHYEPSE